MENILIIALAACATLVPFVLGQRYGAVPLVSPMHLLSYFCAFGFLIKVCIYSVSPEWAFYARFVHAPDAPLRGALYLTAFILTICIGYRAAVSPRDPAAAIAHNRIIAAGLRRHDALFFAAFAIAALTLMLMLDARGASLTAPNLLETFNKDKQINVDANGNGATLAGVKSLFVVAKCAFVLLFGYGLIQQSPRVLCQAALIACLLVGIALVSGDRFELVELFAYGCITFLLLGGGIRARSLATAGCAGAAVLLTSAYMTALRGQDAGLLHQLVGSTYFLDYNASVMITERATSDLRLWGESYVWWGFGWFPRAYWPDKPAIDLGVYFKREVMGLTTGGAFNVTGPGEAFINFGWAGIVIGGLLGWLYRRIEVGLLTSSIALRHASFALYPLLFYPFIQATLQSSFSAFLVGAAAQWVLIAAVIAACVPRFRVSVKGALHAG